MLIACLYFAACYVFRGWGLRTLDDIPSGTFVCTYAGQILNEDMANKVWLRQICQSHWRGLFLFIILKYSDDNVLPYVSRCSHVRRKWNVAIHIGGGDDVLITSLLGTGSADRGVAHHYVILRSQNHRLKKISTMRSKSRDPLWNKLHCETNISQLLPLSICSWQLYVTSCFLMKKKESSSNVQPAIFFLKCVTFRSLFSFAGGKRFWRWVSSWVRSHWWARLYFGSNWVQIWKCGLFNYLF